ncbi:MAG: 30S ribosomal protein S20 [Bdellovibrionota bacterium]
MANTRQSTKRAAQTVKKQARNSTVRSSTQTALRNAIEAIKTKKDGGAQTAYLSAVRALSKAATKGAIPPGRAARKISRLTLLAKRVFPAATQAPKA